MQYIYYYTYQAVDSYVLTTTRLSLTDTLSERINRRPNDLLLLSNAVHPSDSLVCLCMGLENGWYFLPLKTIFYFDFVYQYRAHISGSSHIYHLWNRDWVCLVNRQYNSPLLGYLRLILSPTGVRTDDGTAEVKDTREIFSEKIFPHVFKRHYSVFFIGILIRG